MDRSEQLIADSLSKHAADAPTDDHLLTGVHARLRRRRTSRAVGAVVVAAAAVATAIRIKIPYAVQVIVSAMARSRDSQRLWSSSSASGAAAFRRCASAARSTGAPGVTSASISRGNGSSATSEPLPSQGSTRLCISLSLSGAACAMPGVVRSTASAASLSRDNSPTASPCAGTRICTVKRSASPARQPSEARSARSEAPSASAARNAMMPIMMSSGAAPFSRGMNCAGPRLIPGPPF